MKEYLATRPVITDDGYNSNDLVMDVVENENGDVIEEIGINVVFTNNDCENLGFEYDRAINKWWRESEQK